MMVATSGGNAIADNPTRIATARKGTRPRIDIGTASAASSPERETHPTSISGRSASANLD